MVAENLNISLTKLVILVVEDNADSLALLARLLRTDGHIVHTADGYQAALDVAGREQLDLAVCDIALWDGNGCELVKELQNVKKLDAIAVTGYALADEIAQYRSAGFAAVLPKPLRHSELTSAIDELTSARADEPVTSRATLGHLPNDASRNERDSSARQ